MSAGSEAAPTQAAAAQAQSREGSPAPAGDGGELRHGLNRTYVIDAGLARVPIEPYQRKMDDPVFRPLRIYTVDPTVPKLEGAVALAEVPYEPLEQGPEGRLLRIENFDAEQNTSYRRADLENHGVLLRDGYEPSQADPCFHQQMVYAVCSNVCAAFRSALGRQPRWGPNVQGKLRIFPHARYEANAYYDECTGTLSFGYYEAPADATGRTLPGGFVFTCLSHDIIAHEVTHALLDGLRANFNRPTGPDVMAFHEAFADLIALFQRFSYKDVVRHSIRVGGANIASGGFLTDLANQLGHTTGCRRALRSAMDTDPKTGMPRQMYDELLEPHLLGAVLVAAVFEAFLTIYRRKTERYIRLATAGSGVLPPGELPADLQELLASTASALAGQFMSICIRAIDYCPPVGLNFGDYLRALITADRDLVPHDPWDYRGALIDAFRRRCIYPRSVTNLSEDALLWRPTRLRLPPIEGLSFAKLRFGSSAGAAVGIDELLRQATALGDYVTQPQCLEEFGLVAAGDRRLNGDEVSLPCVHSIRNSRRVGPDGQLVFDLVAEITQTRFVRNSAEHFDYLGGSTVILGPYGEIRFVLLKSVVGHERLNRRLAYVQGAGRRYWEQAPGGELRPRKSLFRMAHAH